MVLLIDTAMVPARERLDFWLESSSDAYLPVHVRSTAKEQFGARMWGYGFGPISFFRIAAAANTMMRTPRAIAACDPECLHLTVVLRGRLEAAQEGRTGIAGDRGRDQLRDVAPGDLPGGRAVRVARRPRADEHLLGRDADRISRLHRAEDPGQRGRAASRRGVLPRTRLRAGRRDGHRRMMRRTPSSASSTSCEACTPCPPAPAGRSACDRARRSCSTSRSFIAANLGDPDLDPERHRPRELHLDALPPQAVRGRGDERVPVDPHVPPGALPSRPARSGSQPSHDPRDREPLGPARPAAFQPPVPRRPTAARRASCGAARSAHRGRP